MRKLLGIFFQLLYHQFAWSYDLVSWSVSLGEWKKWVLSLLPYLKNGEVLELGFGPGHLQLAAHKESHTIYGVDLSPQMTQIAYKRLARNGIQPKLTLGDSRTLPFADQSFDQIVATFPAEYFLDPKMLQETYRILSPSGEIILVPMAWISGSTPIHKFLAWLFRITGQSRDKDGPFVQAGKRIFEEHGFVLTFFTIDYTHSKALILIAKKGI